MHVFVASVHDQLRAERTKSDDPEQTRARLVKRLEQTVAERQRIVARYDEQIRRMQDEIDALEHHMRETRRAAGPGEPARGKRGRR